MIMHDKDLASTRPIGVASALGASALAPEVVFARRVVLTGEASCLQHQSGRWCFLDCLRLLSRVVGELSVIVPDSLPEFQAEVDAVLSGLWSQGRARHVAGSESDLRAATAILNVGPTVRPELPWTSIMANGWVARCTSGAHPLPKGDDEANPLACMLAASFGVTEVFKRVYGVPAHKAAPMVDGAFSLFELSSEFSDFGPALPPEIALPNTLLLGAGAIGNALVLLLSQLPLTGRMLVLDKQTFGPRKLRHVCTVGQRGVDREAEGRNAGPMAERALAAGRHG